MGETVWAIDPTGKYILMEKLRTKLLTAPPPLKIALITPKKYSADYKTVDSVEGWTLARHRIGNALPETFDTLKQLLDQLVEES